MREKLLMLGDQAIALGAIHAGITGVYAYPGTPSTEITEYIQDSPLAQERNIHSQWCTNEKTAMETALGVSYIGKRALVCMKHVGLNVAADAFVNSAMTGTNGGLVVLVADDPSMHSSQNEQDSRFYGKFAFTPIFEPSSQQEAYDMVRYAFDVSEKYELPVLMRLTTRMAHSRAVVEISGIRGQNEIKFPEDKSRWVLLPVNARRRYNELLTAQPGLEKISAESPYNLYKKGSRQGIIACGIGYNYLMESFPDGCDRTVLKISQYPLPKELIREVLNECDEVLILEDGQPFVEEQLRGLLDETGKIKGRLTGELPRVGELTPDNVRAALGFSVKVYQGASENVVARPPALCTGCGHRDVYDALNEVLREYENAKVFSDIGCYTLGALPPFRAIDTCVDMGASITMAKGAADGGLFPSVAVIGDSTFTHSGITGLLDAVNSNASVTIVISDNLTTAMTGGQDSAGYGKLEDICLGVGVEREHLRIVIPLPKNIEEIKDIIREEIEYNGVSVIIPRRECIQTLKKHGKKK
ncbi:MULTISPECIES: thiamine pyrophosphate-dependent enzyme [unclassified Dysgonomonas]|jgi:indolepyruvate ferredoxin oxidoreductase alpha subunit|uniref:thiamine pyrophosphate-dependent enzyme n=1 Tax=unclassified Dysgonomonas TaxID=2630389 RepID=UPI0025C07135|nr:MULTISPECIES: thiamine pyrophosphate-dependent enzyme [unclassified Dysgonomonas]MDR2002357.1 indolepyruvate ferredoxin oxidoreductase [Prevotella sp.]HMM01733.1 thiamine pyrophosphate-dependent enzyme [Dysgonomonas sp.]